MDEQEKQVYMLTTFHITPSGDIQRTRTVGYFPTLATAETSLIENKSLEEDGWYNHAVIEPLKPGLYQICLPCKRVFYAYSKKKWQRAIDFKDPLRYIGTYCSVG